MASIMLFSAGSVLVIVIAVLFSIISSAIKKGRLQAKTKSKADDGQMPEEQLQQQTQMEQEMTRDDLESRLHKSRNEQEVKQQKAEPEIKLTESEGDESRLTAGDMRKAVVMSEILNRKY